MIHRHDEHIPFRWMADRADGTLDAVRAAECDAHLAAACAPCVKRFANVREMLDVIRAGTLDEPPHALDRRVVALFAENRPGTSWAPDDALVGALSSDFTADLGYAMRSGAATSRRLLWTVGEFELDAAVTPSGAGLDVLAQVVPLGDAAGDDALAGRVRAVRGRRAVAEASIESDGRFTFRGLKPGGYTFEGEIACVGAVSGAARPFVLPMVVLG
jgi:hypothetical protein